MIDLIVALSYPDRFVVERTARADVAPSVPLYDDPFFVGWAFGYPMWSDYGFYSPLYGPYGPYFDPRSIPTCRGTPPTTEVEASSSSMATDRAAAANRTGRAERDGW